MTKILLAAIAAFVMAGAAFSGGAEAQCRWTGYSWACAPQSYAYPPSTGWNDPAFGYYRGRGNVPNAAYGAASHLGPEPGGGYCHVGRNSRDTCSTD